MHPDVIIPSSEQRLADELNYILSQLFEVPLRVTYHEQSDAITLAFDGYATDILTQFLTAEWKYHGVRVVLLNGRKGD